MIMVKFSRLTLSHRKGKWANMTHVTFRRRCPCIFLLYWWLLLLELNLTHFCNDEDCDNSTDNYMCNIFYGMISIWREFLLINLLYWPNDDLKQTSTGFVNPYWSNICVTRPHKLSNIIPYQVPQDYMVLGQGQLIPLCISPVMTSWHGNAFCIIGHLWGETTGN